MIHAECSNSVMTFCTEHNVLSPGLDLSLLRVFI